MDVRELKVLAETVTGTIVRIEDAVEVDTQFGRRYRVPVIVDIGDQEIPVSLWVTSAVMLSGKVHSRSNIFSLMRKYGVQRLGDLVGKEVELYLSDRGFYSFAR